MRYFTKEKAVLASFLTMFSLLSFSMEVPVSARELSTTANVHLREDSDINASIIQTIPSDTSVEINWKEGQWYAVTVDGTTGYIRADYLSADHYTSSGINSYVNTNSVNLRSEPNTTSVIKKVCHSGDSISILSSDHGWSEVFTSDGYKGYIYSIYLGNAGSNKPRYDVLYDYKSDAIAYAETRLGDTYSQDYRNLSGYADCSSLVRDAFLSATGVNVGVNTVAQKDNMESYFFSISNVYEANRGDVLYHFNGNRAENHTGIYLGNGKVLEASMSAGKVLIKFYESSDDFWNYGCHVASYCYDQSH